MNPEVRAKVESLCLEALSKDAAERAAFLDEACSGDRELRREVESLLAGHAEADGLLQTPSSIASTPPLPAGTRLGPYEIQSFIGAGGMGQVYKAHDTRLGRTVAIKVLPPDLAAHPDRRRRFEQEARAASALNDPHICTLHDIGSASVAGVGSALEGGTTPATIDYLVMEYLDGETLAARLRKGRLPLEQALEYATQVADALSRAHRQGIVHRDLKPGNVMLTKSGAKLLDFGLAKLRVPSTAAGVMSSVPTRDKSSLTAEGTLLGTVPYMAPEQLEGKEADARSDIFSFGTLLYEMVTGKRAFEGESHASVIAAILEHEPPPLSSLQPVTPPTLDHCVRRCLAKDPEQRWQSAADIAEDLRWLRESSASAPLPPAQRRHRRMVRVVAMAAAVAGAAAGGAALVWWTRPMPRVPIARWELNVKPAESLSAVGTKSRLTTPGGSRTALTWTPDGQTLVFLGRQGADKDPYKALNAQRLYVRPLFGAEEARPLKGTEGAHAPAVSPDGQWVAFWAAGANGAEGAIKKVPLRGGAVQEVFKTDDPPFGLVFDDQGNLFFGRRAFGIWQIREGQASPVTKAEWPLFDILPWPLPGGRVVLYTTRYRTLSWGDERVVAKTLATGEVKVLLENAADARYVPTGHLVFMRQGRLFAVRFDPERLEKLGEEVLVVDEVVQVLTGVINADVTGAGQFAVASTGTLAYLEGGVVAPDPRKAVVMLDRAGKETPLPCPARSYAPAVRFSSANGRRRLAVIIDGLTERGLWLCDLDRDGLLTAVVKEGEVINAPLWFADGQQLAFTWNTDGKMWLARVPSDTGLTTSPRKIVEKVSRLHSFAEGEREVAASFAAIPTALINVEDGSRRDLPPEGLEQPEFSPDGRWLAYMMPGAESRPEIYIRPYPGPGGSLPVSTEGGSSPAWNPNGRELFFALQRGAGQRWLMAADFESGPPPRVGRPHELFHVYAGEIPLYGPAVRLYDVAPDGQHFFAVKSLPPSDLPVVTHVNLITNWFEELKAKVPRK